MKQAKNSMNSVNSLFTDLEPLLVEHFRGASAICDLLDRRSAAILELTATQNVDTYTDEPESPATRPQLRLVRGGG